MWMGTFAPGQSVTVGESDIVVLGIDRGRVRLGVQAPKSVPIVRGVAVFPAEKDGPDGGADDSRN